jgi:hypothetical protein
VQFEVRQRAGATKVCNQRDRAVSDRWFGDAGERVPSAEIDAAFEHGCDFGVRSMSKKFSSQNA